MFTDMEKGIVQTTSLVDKIEEAEEKESSLPSRRELGLFAYNLIQNPRFREGFMFYIMAYPDNGKKVYNLVKPYLLLLK